MIRADAAAEVKPTGLDRRAAAARATTAVALAGFAFAIGGGIDIARTGAVLTVVVLAVTVTFGRAAATGRLSRPFSGSSSLLLMALLAALAAISVSWSILSGDSYFDATLMIAYTAILAAGALVAQLLPTRSREIAGGLMLAALLICLFGLLSRVHPAWFSATDAFARIRMPFDYWNAVGSVAVFGLVGALWLGTTRDLGAWPIALSYPAGGVFLVTLTLSQSRGALFVAVLTLALWLLLAPRRLRSAWWLAAVIVVGVPVVAWAWSQPALSQDFVPLTQRSSTGDTFGPILLLMIAVLAAVGFATERWRRDHSLSSGRRYAVGRVLLVALAISPFAFAGVVAVSSHQGLGKISSSVSDLFDANKAAPSNSPSRLTQTGSLRARYWRDAFKIFNDNTLHGTGADTYSAARLPYRHDTINVHHAHGFVPQTLSDLGIYGLILMLALTIAWSIAMARAAGATARAPFRWLEHAGDTRIADLTIALVAFAFGAHSAIDWTWYAPGVAAFGLVAAGWTFGSRSRFATATHDSSSTNEAATVNRTANLLRAAGITLIGMAMVYSVYQPARAARKVNAGYQLLADGHAEQARQAGDDAHRIDPTSDKPFYLEAAAFNNLRQRVTADTVLARAAAIQPANPDTWIHLADYRLNTLNDPARALEALKPLLFLSPNNERGVVLHAQAEQALVTKLLQQQIEQSVARIKHRARTKTRRPARH